MKKTEALGMAIAVIVLFGIIGSLIGKVNQLERDYEDKIEKMELDFRDVRTALKSIDPFVLNEIEMERFESEGEWSYFR